MDKRLYKSNENKMLDGVCGGIAEYFNMDRRNYSFCIGFNYMDFIIFGLFIWIHIDL